MPVERTKTIYLRRSEGPSTLSDSYYESLIGKVSAELEDPSKVILIDSKDTQALISESNEVPDFLIIGLRSSDKISVDLDQLRVIKESQNLWSKVSIIVFSSYLSEDFEDKVLDSGAIAYVERTHDIDGDAQTLASIINNTIAKRDDA